MYEKRAIEFQLFEELNVNGYRDAVIRFDITSENNRTMIVWMERWAMGPVFTCLLIVLCFSVCVSLFGAWATI